jgi:hypothetical protein
VRSLFARSIGISRLVASRERAYDRPRLRDSQPDDDTTQVMADDDIENPGGGRKLILRIAPTPGLRPSLARSPRTIRVQVVDRSGLDVGEIVAMAALRIAITRGSA